METHYYVLFDHLNHGSMDYINNSISDSISKGVDLMSLNYVLCENHNRFTRTTEAFNALFDHALPEQFAFPPGAQYIVSRDSILCRSKEFYQTISDVMSTINNTTCSFNNCLVCPWTIERIWPFIFDKSFANKDIKYEDLL